jgi:serine/threonine protein kinase
MADVYLAEQESLSRHVAVKVLRPETTVRPAAVERFVLEARAAAALVHGNIVQIHEVGCFDGRHFIVEEYVAGPSLKAWLDLRGPLELRQALAVLCDVGSALARAGQQGVVHRDIKPENLLLTREGEVKVADFGLARVREHDLGLTQDGTTLGTPLYMSPEQAEGREVDPRSDLYSLGATVYHLLAGRPPFCGTTGVAVAMAHVRDPVVPLASLRPDLPESLIVIINTLLAKRPDERYATAGDLLREVERLALPLAGGSHRGPSPLAWEGDLDQWAVGGAEVATTVLTSAAGGGVTPEAVGRGHARTQAMRAATMRLQMALEDDRAAVRSTRRFWVVVALATVIAAGLGFFAGQQRWRRLESPWRRTWSRVPRPEGEGPK